MGFTLARINVDVTQWELFKKKFPNQASERLRAWIDFELNRFNPIKEENKELDELKEMAQKTYSELQEQNSNYNNIILKIKAQEEELEKRAKELKDKQEEEIKQKKWLRDQHRKTFFDLRHSDNVREEEL